MNELYIQSNISSIILIIVLIGICIFGYLEFKKLSVKIDMLNTKYNSLITKFQLYENNH